MYVCKSLKIDILAAVEDGRMFRVLVADDHAAVLEGLCSILSSRHNIEVCARVRDGNEAIKEFTKFRPDLVILDVNMPNLDGLSAARAIKKLDSGVPILFLTMHDSAVMVNEARSIGVQGYVSKSQASGTLLKAVDAVLNHETFFPQ
jgi:two-component system NarL family response regulator